MPGGIEEESGSEEDNGVEKDSGTEKEGGAREGLAPNPGLHLCGLAQVVRARRDVEGDLWS